MLYKFYDFVGAVHFASKQDCLKMSHTQDMTMITLAFILKNFFQKNKILLKF